MPMAQVTADRVEAAVLKVRHRITVDEFRRMAAAGALGHEPRRYELIKGVIVERMSEGADHVQSCMLLEDLLHRIVPLGYVPTMGHPVTDEEDDSAPIPDAMVLRGRIRDYAGRDLTPADAALVIEVSNTSLPRDRGWKKDLYAEMGVPVYWVLNLVDRCLEVYRDPLRPRGARVATYATEEPPKSARSQARLVLDGREVARFRVSEILP
jgi:Uma2 family endonuclease